MQKKDELFKDPHFAKSGFKFNKDVAEVFEDMLFRSIPNYESGLAQCCDLIFGLLPKVKIGTDEQTLIYDLGCSTGHFLRKLAIHLILAKDFDDHNFHFVGVDKSPSMIEQAKEQCQRFVERNKMTLLKQELTKVKLPEKQSAAIISNYTLQFLAPENKIEVLQKSYNSLRPSGIFLLGEKICTKDGKIDELFIDLYHNYKKKNGYSEEEIRRKQHSLEKVLFPQTVEKHISQLKKVGFKKVEIVNKWCNFTTFLAVK